MRILHIIAGDLWAGAEVQVYNTLLSLQKQSDIKVLCVVFNPGILFHKLKKSGVTCEVIDDSKYSFFSMIFRFLKISRAFNPDIIHAHRNKEHFFGVMTSLGLFRKTPVCRTIHGLSEVTKTSTLKVRFKSTIAVSADKFLIRYTAKIIICVSKNIHEILVRKNPLGKAILIYNAIDSNSIIRLDKNQSLKTKFVIGNKVWIGTAARFVPIKNLEMLIHAGKKLQQKSIPFQISIFGDGPLKKSLSSLIKSASLENHINLEPFEENILPIISSFDIFVLCSHHEGMPMSLLEAMALSRPVICTAVGGMKEIIKDRLNGLLVPDNDSTALANAIALIHNDANFAKSIANNARTTIENNFDITQTTKQLIDVYKSLKK
jgi:glycosyltransferase involved in cell wall biosynthesis